MIRSIATLVLVGTLWAQAAGQTLQVYPGDVTNNGQVNNLDFLQLGLAYNFAGPARDSSSLNFEPKDATPWPLQLPGGLNMAYADCNGDGFVNYYFDAFPLYTNYGLQRSSNVTPDVFVAGLAGVDPPLQFDSTAIPNLAQGGQLLQVPIELGTAELPAEDVYGLAFSVKLDPAVFNLNQTVFNFSESSWANPDNDRIWMSKKAAPDRIDVAWVRTDRNHKRGYGRIGYADFVIIVDVIPLLHQTPIVIERIKMMDKFGNYATVAGDTVWVKFAPDNLSSDDSPNRQVQIDVYPNPANNRLFVRTDEFVHSIALFDVLGRAVFQQTAATKQDWTDLNLPQLPGGFYLLRVETERGVGFRQVQIQQN